MIIAKHLQNITYIDRKMISWTLNEEMVDWTWKKQPWSWEIRPYGADNGDGDGALRGEIKLQQTCNVAGNRESKSAELKLFYNELRSCG